MTKVVLTDTQSGYQLSKINENFQKIEDELNNRVLYRDNPTGEVNQMESILDMNSKRIINLPAPQNPTDAARLGDIPTVPVPIGTTSALLTTFTPALSLSSTNVQAAIEELLVDIQNRLLSTALDTDNLGMIGFKQSGTGAATRTALAKARESLSVDDFILPSDTDATDGINKAIAYASVLAQNNAYNSPAAAVKFGPGPYYFSSNIPISTAGVILVGNGGRGSKLVAKTGVTVGFDVGNWTVNSARNYQNGFYGIRLSHEDNANNAVGIRLYRLSSVQIIDCNFDNWDITIDSFRSSAVLNNLRIITPTRTTPAYAFIRMQGTDESNWTTPNTYTPGGSWHMSNIEMIGAVNNPNTHGMLIHSADGVYMSNVHINYAKYRFHIQPLATPENRVITDINGVNMYMDDSGTSNSISVWLDGTVKESITNAAGGTVTSIYQNIRFSGNSFFRGAYNDSSNLRIAVTDGDSWWDSSRRLDGLLFNGVTFTQSQNSCVLIQGATTGFVECYVRFIGCEFSEGGQSSPATSGWAIQANCEAIQVLGCGFLIGSSGTTDYVVQISVGDTGNDFPLPSALMIGNDYTRATGYSSEPERVTRGNTGVNVVEMGSLYPGSGRQVDKVYKLRTNNATTQTIWSYGIPEGTSGDVEVILVGADPTGAKSTRYRWNAGFYRATAGSLTLQGGAWTNTAAYNPGALATPPTADVSANTLRVQVTGVIGFDIDWTCHVKLLMSR